MPKYFRILSIDGGGLRGVIPAIILRKLSQSTKEPIWRYFDLVTGTSTGGIIALAVVLNKPLDEIEELYKTLGKKLFIKPSPRKKIDSARHYINAWKTGSLYNPELLLSFLEKEFKIEREDGTKENALIKDAQTRLCIPTFDITHGKIVLFKTPHIVIRPDRRQFTDDANKEMYKVAAATSAAPIFFNTSSVENSYFIDGGLWANNPEMVGLLEAYRSGFSFDQVKLLSIGTGSYVFQRETSVAKKMHLKDWGLTGVVEATLEAQTQAAAKMSRLFLDDRNHTRLQYEFKKNIPMDDVSSLPDLISCADRLFREQGDNVIKNFFQSVTDNPNYKDEKI